MMSLLENKRNGLETVFTRTTSELQLLGKDVRELAGLVKKLDDQGKLGNRWKQRSKIYETRETREDFIKRKYPLIQRNPVIPAEVPVPKTVPATVPGERKKKKRGNPSDILIDDWLD